MGLTVVQSNFERKEHDLYQTEEWATEALLRHVDVNGRFVAEVAAGGHAMVRVLARHGARVWTNDIHEYHIQNDCNRDFLDIEVLDCEAIITNPPYGKGGHLARKFCEHALELCDGWVAMLLTAKFDFGSTRKHLFADNPRFAYKIALTDRIKWFNGPSLGTEDHAWYVWGPLKQSILRPTLKYEGRVAAYNARDDHEKSCAYGTAKMREREIKAGRIRAS